MAGGVDEALDALVVAATGAVADEVVGSEADDRRRRCSDRVALLDEQLVARTRREPDDAVVVFFALKGTCARHVSVEDELTAVIYPDHRRKSADGTSTDGRAGRGDARQRSGARPRSENAASAFVIAIVHEETCHGGTKRHHPGGVHGDELGPTRELAAVGKRVGLLREDGLRPAGSPRNELNRRATHEVGGIESDRAPDDAIVDDGGSTPVVGQAGSMAPLVPALFAWKLKPRAHCRTLGRTTSPTANAVFGAQKVSDSMSGSQVAPAPRKFLV